MKMRAAQDAGHIHAVDVRASDYFGPEVPGPAHLGKSFFTAVLRSKTAHVVGKPQLAHSWSYLPDIVTTLIATTPVDVWDFCPGGVLVFARTRSISAKLSTTSIYQWIKRFAARR
ncbi:hypothetical protein [Cryobacterium sp. Hz9]|uniref:hypothetical protein n=1 Tax=Cryobacterium sp. Hz9 TaxID=1259167 RepID=UPI0010699355|nr:hypothetical protein [Cryobacterium sp. Hz9]TFB65757.1 hypothetical protein E3N85_11785 [Cryobacterium sp. Hz9]